MKTLMFAGSNSNSGKTLISSAVIRALKKKGLNIVGFKAGPDFVDNYFLTIASGRRAGNLDPFLMDRAGMDRALAFTQGEYGIIEGVMGYYDGISNGWQGSSFDIARTYSIPTILVYSPKGEMFTAIAKIKGMVDLSEGLIKGVIFNKCSKKMYSMLSEKLEEVTSTRALGYIPYDKSLIVHEDRMGLELSQESELDSLLDRAGEVVVESLDMEGIIDLFKDISLQEKRAYKKRAIITAIAKDRAFTSLYTENLRLLEELGQVVYFSPLEDKTIPKADLLYLTNGYQIDYADKLSGNKEMLEEIRRYGENGGFILAEGGGFEYINKSVNGFTMVGLFEGEVVKRDRLINFGYHTLSLEDSLLGTGKIKVHEYHKSEILGLSGGIGRLEKNGVFREAGFQNKNVFGMEQMVNFAGCPWILENLADKIQSRVAVNIDN